MVCVKMGRWGGGGGGMEEEDEIRRYGPEYMMC